MKKNQIHPEQDPHLREGLQAIKAVPEIEPAQQRRLQADFIQQIQRVRAESVTFSRNSRLNHQKHNPNPLVFRWRTSTMTVKMIGIIAAIAIALSGAGAGTVYAAQSALPDDGLYDLKLWSEEVRLDLTSAPEKDLALHLAFADRRVDEMLALQAENKAIDPELNLELTGHLWMAEQLVEQCEDPLQAQAQVQQRLMNQEQLLANAPEDALMTQTRSMIRQQLHLMECEPGDEDCQQQACEEGGCMLGDQPMTHDQIREQLREDQPEGAGSETGNGYTGEYPEPQQGNDGEPGPDGEQPGSGGNGANQDGEPGSDGEQPGNGGDGGGGNGK
jgi:hypothetical protein